MLCIDSMIPVHCYTAHTSVSSSSCFARFLSPRFCYSEQKQQLEDLRIKQVIAKEQRLLTVQLGSSSTIPTSSTSTVQSVLSSQSSAAVGDGVDSVTGVASTAGSKKPPGVSNDSSLSANKMKPTALSDQSAVQSMFSSILEDCGVTTTVMPIDLLQGLGILVDAVVVPPSLVQPGVEFRIALGVYDNTGKSIVRLVASPWQLMNLDKNYIISSSVELA